MSNRSVRRAAFTLTPLAFFFVISNPDTSRGDVVLTAVNPFLQVREGDSGDVQLQVKNTSATKYVSFNSIPGSNGDPSLNNSLLFLGDDKDDEPLFGPPAGCDGGSLLPPGQFCSLTLHFTTPAVKDTGPDDENGDRGEWIFNILAPTKGNNGSQITYNETDSNGNNGGPSKMVELQTSGVHILVFDPGVAFIPEPSPLLTSGLLIAAALGYGRLARNRKSVA